MRLRARLTSDDLEAAIRREQPQYPFVPQANGKDMNIPVVIDLRNGQLRPLALFGALAGDGYLSLNRMQHVSEAARSGP
jgi:hypothetical protein